MDRQRRPRQSRKDSFESVSACVGLIVDVPRVEKVFVQRRNHIRKVQTGIYMFAENTFGWVWWWFGSWEFRHLIGYFISWDVLVARNPNETDLVARSSKRRIEKGNFICETMLFPVPICDRLQRAQTASDLNDLEDF